MTRIIQVFALLMALATPASAYQLRGYGLTSCAILNAYHSSPTDEWPAVKQWIWGYLSGVNAAFESVGRKDVFSQIYFDASYNSIRRYCEGHPDDQIIAGVNEFIREVQSQ